MSGTRPHLISRTAIRTSGVTKRMSAPRASWNPPPKATPCMAAITGTVCSRQTMTACWAWLDPPSVRLGVTRPAPPRRSPEAILAKLPMSRPAQKARPSPDSTMARTPVSVLRRSPVSTRAWNMRSSRAFILSVRTRRTSATPFSRVTWMRSSMEVSFRSCRGRRCSRPGGNAGAGGRGRGSPAPGSAGCGAPPPGSRKWGPGHSRRP